MRRWVLALIVATGCGPVAYINQVTRDASTKVARAEALNAKEWSPYWFTRAKTYLKMAREVAGHADFQGANRFGRLSSEAAEIAATEAEAAGKDPSKRPVNPMLAPAAAKSAKEDDVPTTAPAKDADDDAPPPPAAKPKAKPKAKAKTPPKDAVAPAKE